MSPPRLSRLVARQGGACFYCSCTLTTAYTVGNGDVAHERSLAVRAATRDHFVPKGAGGSDCGMNFVAACGPCNQDKAARLPTLTELIRFVELNCLARRPLPYSGGPLMVSLAHRARRVQRALERLESRARPR